MITVHITPESLGPVATDADALKMVELLRAKGYDARLGTGRDHDKEDSDQEQYDADWQECLGQLG